LVFIYLDELDKKALQKEKTKRRVAKLKVSIVTNGAHQWTFSQNWFIL
jgi:hypothetical protein